MVLAQQGKPPLENVRNLEGVCVFACTRVHVHISVLRLRGFTINVIEARDLRNAQTCQCLDSNITSEVSEWSCNR